MNKILFLALIALFTYELNAQELNCRVNVSAARLQTADPKIFKTLSEDLTKFMNDRKWTDNTYEDDEKIECTINIVITDEKSSDIYSAQATIQANRPVFNSDYKTTLINFSDERFTFQYVESQALDFNPNDYLNELTSLMAYYAYTIIGLDYDSFSKNGGNPYFLKAQAVVNNAQNNSGSDGWKPFSTTINRYWYIENMLNNRYKVIRDVNYNYHRKALDQMFEDPFAARAEVIGVLELLDKLYKERPNLMIMQLFFKAKSNEIIQILSDATANEKVKAAPLLQKLDPTNTSRYQQLIRGVAGAKGRSTSFSPSNFGNGRGR